MTFIRNVPIPPRPALQIRGAIVFLILLSSASFASTCETTSRSIGPLGAVNTGRVPVEIAAGLRAHLPQAAKFAAVIETKLSKSGEQIVIYDSSADELDPRPQIAVVVAGKIVNTFDPSEIAEGGGFDRYLASCQFDMTPTNKAEAIAFQNAGDGSGSSFLVIAWQGNKYRVVFTKSVSQGRLVLSPFALTVWENTGPSQCVWCFTRYTTTKYRWHNGRYSVASSRRLKALFDPELISNTPLVLDASEFAPHN